MIHFKAEMSKIAQYRDRNYWRLSTSCNIRHSLSQQQQTNEKLAACQEPFGTYWLRHEPLSQAILHSKLDNELIYLLFQGQVEVVNNTKWSYCMLIPVIHGHGAGVQSGLGAENDLLIGYDNVFEQSSHGYRILSICMFEVSKTSVGF